MVFIALVAGMIGLTWRAHTVSIPVRWLVGAPVVLLVLLGWALTMHPQQHEVSGGVATCIEEPLFGMSTSSGLSSPLCLQANRVAMALILAGSGAVVVAGGLALRVIGRRGATDS